MSVDLELLRGKIIVSCQAYPGEPMRHPDTMAQIAQSVVAGGAAAVRLQGVEDIKAGAEVLDVPIIGIVKEGDEGVYITPSLGLAISCADAGAKIVALDGTDRTRADKRSFAETVSELKRARDVRVMADCDSLSSAEHALAGGADILGTTLAGYTSAREKTSGPDFELLASFVERFPGVPVIAEGRIHSPADAKKALSLGAFSIVVGTAITHPTSITSWFVAALD